MLHDLAARLDGVRGRPHLVAVDGPDGSGKTVLADALAAHLRAAGRDVLRVGIDGFHQPRAVRYRQGRASPAGFLEDSYDLDAFRRSVLAPLRPGGDRWVRTAAFDHRADRPVDAEPVLVEDATVVVVDGIFLLRRELADEWDLAVLLECSFEETFRRMAVRDGCPADPDRPDNARYVQGQLLYRERHAPATRADVVIDNEDPQAPVVLRG